MIDYILLGTILFYFFIVKVSGSSALGVILSAVTVVFVPFVFSTTIQGIILSIVGAPLSQLVTIRGVVALVLQFLLAWYVFYRMEMDGESFASWIGWSIAGCIGIYFGVPWLVGAVLPGF